MEKGDEEQKLVAGGRNRYTMGLDGARMSTGRNCGFGWRGKQSLGVWGQRARKGGTEGMRQENKVLDCKRFVELIVARSKDSKRRLVT